MIYMIFIRLVNYGKPSSILVFSKKKKIQIIQKDVLCTTTTSIISFTV